MTIFGIFIVMVIVGIILTHKSGCDDDMEIAGLMIGICGGLFLVVAIIAIPFAHIGYNADIAKFNAYKATIESLRAEGEVIESAAAVIKMAEANGWLASEKVWNAWYACDIWIPDEINDLEPIR